MTSAAKLKRKRAPAPIDPAKLQGYVARIEAVELRIVEERDARADIYTEVKASGMRPKMVRKIIKERAKKEEDAAEAAELERYRAAMAMPGATVRSVAAQFNVPRSTLHRRLSHSSENGTTTPHDPATGEVIEDAAPQPEVSNGEDVCGSGRADPEPPVSAAEGGAEGHSSDGGGEAGAVDAADARHAEPTGAATSCAEPPRAPQVESKSALSDEAALAAMLELHERTPYLRRERAA